MGLDPRFIPATYFELYFVDKDTLGPLSGGIITFYSDVNRTQLKPVYEISGTPPNYVYTPLPNPIFTNGDGTFSDNAGNNIVPYFFPYVGVPADNNNTIELYYITVTNSLSVLQFTREGVPNLTGADFVATEITNLVPNGQFLLHNNGGSQVLDTTSVPGINRLEIAQGGWTFEVGSASTSINTVTFQSFNGFVTPLPTESPEFACRVSCTSPVADSRKDLCLNFFDVNKFAASVTPPSNPQQYTLYFEAQSNSGSFNVDVYVIKFFGIGGSATSAIHKATINIGTSYAQHQTVFDFGDNTGDNITTGDFVQIAIRFPLNSVFDGSFTNFVLTPNNVNVTSFPITPNDEMISKSLAYLPTPASDGSDLYLPLLYGPEGFFFDDSQIGKILYTITTVGIGELAADGSTYSYNAYSSDGIPYSRLGNVLYSLTTSIPGNPPPYGTGQQFVTTYQLTSSPTGAIRFHTNQASISVAASAGSVTPLSPFTVNNDHFATNYFINAYLSTSSSIICEQVVAGSVDATKFTAGTSGLTISLLVNAPTVQAVFSVGSFVAVTAPLAGKYFTFQSANGPTNYYVWFKVDGAGADPVPAGFTGIQVNLYSYYTATDFACAVRESISGYQLTSVVTTAGGTVPAGSYFTFSTLLTNYFVWYTVNGAGVQPVVSGTPILVAILSSDTATQVALKTATAMNRVSYAVPDFRGKFLRVWNNGSSVDPNASSRLGHISYLSGDLISTLQLDNFQNHLHGITSLAGSQNGRGTAHLPVKIGGGGAAFNLLNTGVIGTTDGNPVNYNYYPDNYATNSAITSYVDGVNTLSNGNTNYFGFSETRPINEMVNCVIKY
jgi:hypothetical protein